MLPSNVVCSAFLFLTNEVCWTLKIGKSHQIKLWQVELLDLCCPFVSIWSVIHYLTCGFPTCQICLSISDAKDLRSFRTFCKPCNRNISEPSEGTISKPSCSFVSVELVVTCGFQPVISTRPNVISRGLPIFGSFCKPLRNVVTETFAEPSANWEVSSNWILTGTIRESSCSFICVKLVINYLTCGFRPVISTRQNVISRGLPIFGRFCKRLRNVVTEIFAESSENSKNWEVSWNRILTGRPSSSLINVKLVINYLTCGFPPVISTLQNVISRGLPIFGSYCKPQRNVVTETFAEPSANWEVSSNWILTGTIRGSSCSFICVKLVINYLTCGFRPVISTRQNVISRGLPIFGRFCKRLRNVVTETFAEPSENSENWEVSSNGILTGRPSSSLINVKLVIHYLMYRFRPFSSTCLHMRWPELPIFRKFCKPLRNFVTKTFQSCSQRVSSMGICKGVLTVFDLWLCHLQDLLFDFSVKSFVLNLGFFDFPG